MGGHAVRYLIGGVGGHEGADEVHQVVARKGQGQGKGAGQHGKLEGADAQNVLQQAGEQQPAHKDAGDQGAEVILQHVQRGFVYQAAALQTLEDGKVSDGREGQGGPQRADEAVHALVAEAEEESAEPHDHAAAGEGHNHGGEDTGDNPQGIAAVDVFPQVRADVRAAGVDLEEGHGDARAQQFEHQGYRGGGGHAEGVEEVQQDDVRQHHGQEEDHDVVEAVHVRQEDAAAGYLHHAGGKRGTQHHAHRRHSHQHTAAGGSAAHGRVEEVRCIIGDAHGQVVDGEGQQEQQNQCVEYAHDCLVSLLFNR